MLYPDHELPGFLEKNIIPADAVAACPLLSAMAASGDTRLVIRDADGHHRFAAGLANASVLNERLAALAADPRWAGLAQDYAPRVRATYERVFNHRAFTGRSGSMFGYEGLGCVYWHMVAKLLVAVQENLFAAEAAGDPQAARLASFYHDVRAGLGFNKTPGSYGAFPTDPYSHTPGHSGAQQPGMTGQVKEEILTRLGELGVRISRGCVSFAPTLLKSGEFLGAKSALAFVNAAGAEAAMELPSGTLGFTFCRTPVTYMLSEGAPCIRIHQADGTTEETGGRQLDGPTSARLFARDGGIASVEVRLGSDYRAYGAP